MSRPRRRRDPSPRNIHVAAAASPRLVSTDYPRLGRGVAVTWLHVISTSRPRRRRDSAPRNIHVPAAASPRLRLHGMSTSRAAASPRLAPTAYPRRPILQAFARARLAGRSASADAAAEELERVQDAEEILATASDQLEIINRVYRAEWRRSPFGLVLAALDCGRHRRSNAGKALGVSLYNKREPELSNVPQVRRARLRSPCGRRDDSQLRDGVRDVLHVHHVYAFRRRRRVIRGSRLWT